MKKNIRSLTIFCLIFTLVLMGCLSSGGGAALAYKPGAYEGSAQGYGGTIRVKVLISESGIEDIEILDHSESFFPGTSAMEELLDNILIEGSTEIDGISGASFTSRGFIGAVENAIEIAR